MVPASPMVPVKRARPSKTVGCFTTNKPRNINHHAPDSLLVQAASCLKISDDGQGSCAVHFKTISRLNRQVCDGGPVRKGSLAFSTALAGMTAPRPDIGWTTVPFSPVVVGATGEKVSCH